MAGEFSKKAATHLEQCLTGHLPDPLDPKWQAAARDSPTDAHTARVQTQTRQYEFLKGERDNLVAVAKLYVKNKAILTKIGALWRRKRVVERAFKVLKDLRDLKGNGQLRGRIFRLRRRELQKRAIFESLKSAWLSKKERELLVTKKQEAETAATEDAGRLENALQQLQSILESRLGELATKTARLAAIKKRYSELSE